MMMQENFENEENLNRLFGLPKKFQELEKKYQSQLDRLTPYSFYRWLTTLILILIFLLRILLSQGWYIITYALGIYLLNLFLSFLQPKFDPSIEQDLIENEVEEGITSSTTTKTTKTTTSSSLNSNSTNSTITSSNSTLKNSSKFNVINNNNNNNHNHNQDFDEFRPFIRRLPEFKFWLSATRATIFSLIATLFEFTDVPVFWPILLIYFLILFSLTMRRQISHMKRYKYVPWDYMRKARYNGNK